MCSNQSPAEGCCCLCSGAKEKVEETEGAEEERQGLILVLRKIWTHSYHSSNLQSHSFLLFHSTFSLSLLNLLILWVALGWKWGKHHHHFYQTNKCNLPSACSIHPSFMGKSNNSLNSILSVNYWAYNYVLHFTTSLQKSCNSCCSFGKTELGINYLPGQLRNWVRPPRVLWIIGIKTVFSLVVLVVQLLNCLQIG